MKKSYVVFGGSGGIGFECAKTFNDGAVVIADINEEALSRAKLELEAEGIEAHIIKCDITNPMDVKEVAKLAASVGEIEAVINTAGLSSSGNNAPLVMKVNLVGTAVIVDEFLAYAKPGMVMVCLASMLGYKASGNPAYDDLLKNYLSPSFMEEIEVHLQDSVRVAYALSKYAVQRLCEEKAPIWGKKGARIISVSPGVIETPMAFESPVEILEGLRKQTPLGRNGKPEDVAQLIKFLCSSFASFITGCDIRIDGGLVKQL